MIDPAHRERAEGPGTRHGHGRPVAEAQPPATSRTASPATGDRSLHGTRPGPAPGIGAPVPKSAGRRLVAVRIV
jgi:hypothetical protein